LNSSFVLGKIRGIEIGINYTWLIALGLITWSLAVGFFPAQFPGWQPETYWTVAALASLLLFGSVLVHELAHSFVAQSLGMRVQSINLFIFGGVSNIVGEAKRARDEFYISAVGPLTSIALSLLFGFGFWLLRGVNPQLTALLLYLGLVNALLAVFNLIPGFPLDGGRVFRAIVWGITQSFRRATSIATAVGKGFAYLFIFGGLYLAVSGEFLSGIWLVFIGWFLSEAAEASYRQMTVQESFRGVHVADLMNPQPVTVDTNATLRDVVDDYILRRNVRTLLVVENGRLVGLITPHEIRAVPAERWPEVLVAQAMIPIDRLHTVAPRDDAGNALRALSEEDVNQLPVVENGRLVGVLSRANLIRFLQVRQELGVGSRT
jgi:Zn-dependent protease/CBS domain-containing protein